MSRSWLLNKDPPSPATSAEARLWWAVIQQAASDLRYASRGEALDALEFLEATPFSTGLWLANVFFNIPPTKFRKEVARLRRAAKSKI